MPPLSKFKIENLVHQFLLNGFDGIDDIALIEGDSHVTYRDLIQLVNKGANYLDQLGVNRGDVVIVISDNCINAIVAILSILSVGGVFVPISPDNPPARIKKIIKTTNPSVIFVHNGSLVQFDDHLLVRTYSELTNHIEVAPEYNFRDKKLLPSDLAYIIFTSGTTGEPKGIKMSHGAVVDFMRNLISFNKHESTIQKIATTSPLQFDFSILDIGLALGGGKTLVITPRILIYKPTALIEYWAKREVTQVNSVPTIWQLLLTYAEDGLKSISTLQTILYAGEAFPVSNIMRIQSMFQNIRVINCFGQSESIACSFFDVPIITDSSESISIGKGYNTNEMLLVDEQFKIINEPNVHGEILLRSESLFSGYWMDDEKTNKSLVRDPFFPETSRCCFRTGDIAFFDISGNYFYVGRKDSQIKINGNRIELHEIKQVILDYEYYSDVEIIFYNNKLYAFLLKKYSQAELSNVMSDIRKKLNTQLPKYMMPESFFEVEVFPLTVNGKIDKVKLIEMHIENFL